ncbi:hypothetical protein BCR33DRAFT_711542, partial [Rhizoclosmatium globosum]
DGGHNVHTSNNSHTHSHSHSLNHNHNHHAQSAKPGTFANRNFYQNTVVEKYASRESKLVTLRQLTVFGRNLTFDKLLRSANYVREELPVRLAHRIIDIQHLPFIVGTNPHIQLIYSLYWQAFEAFRTFPEIKTVEQNRQFCDLIESQLQTHLVIIPHFHPEHMTAEMADRFLNEMLRSRIGRRVLAEQHIALSDTYEQNLAANDLTKKAPNGTAALIEEEDDDGWIGIVNTRCRATEVVDRVSVLAKRWFRDTYPNRGVEPPEVKIDGHINAVFTYIPDHIEYILFELFKNSMRFTLETHGPDVAAASAADNSETPKVHSAPIYGRGHQLNDLEPINPNHVEEPRSPKQSQIPPPKSSKKTSSSQPKPAAPQQQQVQSSSSAKKLPPILSLSAHPAPTLHSACLIKAAASPTPKCKTSGPTLQPPATSSSTTLPTCRNSRKIEEIRHQEGSSANGESAVSRRASGRPFELEENSLHLGLGLPMSRVYANYWGGTIGVHSMHGFGTDAYMEQLKYTHGEGFS